MRSLRGDSPSLYWPVCPLPVTVQLLHNSMFQGLCEGRGRGGGVRGGGKVRGEGGVSGEGEREGWGGMRVGCERMGGVEGRRGV